MNYKWEISELSGEDEIITHAKYHLTLSDGETTVETEGNWHFKNPQKDVPFNEITEEMVVQWIENEAMKDGICVIKSRLEEQLALLEKSKSIVPPWKPQVFTPNI
jgi:hypothetical protein